MTISIREFAKNPRRHLRHIKQSGPISLTSRGRLIGQIRSSSDFTEIVASARTLAIAGMGPNTKGLIKLVSEDQLHVNAADLISELAFDKNHTIVVMDHGQPKYAMFCYVHNVEMTILDHADAMGRPYTLDRDDSAEAVQRALDALDG